MRCLGSSAGGNSSPLEAACGEVSAEDLSAAICGFTSSASACFTSGLSWACDALPLSFPALTIGGIEITGNQGIGRPQRSSQILRLIKRRSKRASLSGQARFIGSSEVLREDVVSEPGGRRRIGGIRLIVIVVIAVPGIVVVAPAVISGCRPRVVGPSVVNGLVIVRRRITVIRCATVIVGAVGIHVTSAAYVIRALDISPASAVK